MARMVVGLQLLRVVYRSSYSLCIKFFIDIALLTFPRDDQPLGFGERAEVHDKTT